MLLRNNFPSGDTVHMICLYMRTEFLIKINRFRATTDDPEYQKWNIYFAQNKTF